MSDEQISTLAVYKLIADLGPGSDENFDLEGTISSQYRRICTSGQVSYAELGCSQEKIQEQSKYQ